MPKCIENEVYDLNRTQDPRDVDWELDTARNYGAAPYPQPSLNIEYAQAVFIEGVNVGFDVHWKDGSVSQMPEVPAPTASDNDVGYHNLTLEDL